jgi:hypothetical protein
VLAGSVAEHGPGCDGKLPTGTPVVAVPPVRGAHGIDAVGLSALCRSAIPRRTPRS